MPRKTKAEKFIHEIGFKPDTISGYMQRTQYIAKFGFAILTSTTIKRIRPYSPIIEIGAGNGYWAYELQRAGIDVIATDTCTGRYASVNGHWEQNKWLQPLVMTAKQATQKYPDRTLLTVWPDYNVPWPAQALAAYKGPRVLYVGEGYGGCTANDRFHMLLEHHYILIETIDIPQFYGLHDVLEVWERKTKKTRATRKKRR